MSFEFTRKGDTLRITSDDVDRDLKLLMREPNHDEAWQFRSWAVLKGLGRLPRQAGDKGAGNRGLFIPLPKEEPTMTAETIEAKAKAHGLSLEAFLATEEGGRLYREDRERRNAAAANPTPRQADSQPTRFGEHFEPGHAEALADFEADIAEQAKTRCREKGIVADRNGIAIAMSELLAEDPAKYTAYQKLQLRPSH